MYHLCRCIPKRVECDAGASLALAGGFPAHAPAATRPAGIKHPNAEGIKVLAVVHTNRT